MKHLYEVMFSTNGLWRMSLQQKRVSPGKWVMLYEVLVEWLVMLSSCGVQD